MILLRISYGVLYVFTTTCQQVEFRPVTQPDRERFGTCHSLFVLCVFRTWWIPPRFHAKDPRFGRKSTSLFLLGRILLR
jgi:hypothetical protein